jgi:uncharacterized protein
MNRKMNPMQPEALWEKIIGQFALERQSVHGPSHWRQVEHNGFYLAQTSGARIDVVRLFAVFHDSRRLNEYNDPEHGPRGAKLAQDLRGLLYEIDDQGFELLHEACWIHTEAPRSDEPTLGTCLDADRLDLPRVGISPQAEYMSTEAGKNLAKSGDFGVLRNFEPRQ